MAVTNQLLSQIGYLIEKSFHSPKGCLEEPKEKMMIPIDPRGVQYKLFSFDKELDRETYPKGLFPFFNKIAGAHSVCDYMLWACSEGKTYILLIELKKGNQQAGPQLRAGKHLAQYITDTFNRINNLHIRPEIRMISIHNACITKKGKTHMNSIKYNSEGMANFKGKTFCIAEFMQSLSFQ